MAKATRICTKWGRGKGGRRVCRKYRKVRAGKVTRAYRTREKSVRRGLKSGRYKTVCSSFTERLFGGKRRKQFRCRDKASGKFAYGRYCSVGSRCNKR